MNLLAKIRTKRCHGLMFQYLAQADHKNEATGGLVVLRKFTAGTNIPAHTHPVANEWAYILSGEWVESDVTYGPGTLFHAPEGEHHGPHVAKTEVISLTIFDGPLTLV